MPRLRRANLSAPGYTRARSGTGFTYHDRSGQLVDADERDALEALAIPPAWTDVWISQHPNSHVLATGVDTAGRRQYLYHPQWRARRDRTKFDRMLVLAESLPAARGWVTRDLGGDAPTQRRALAAAFRLLDVAHLRVGNERYATRHGSRGISTLRVRDATVDGDAVLLRFPAKSGQTWESEVVDAPLARVLAERSGADPDDRLLGFAGDAPGEVVDARADRSSSLDDALAGSAGGAGGEGDAVVVPVDVGGRDVWVALDAAAINEDVRARTGGEFSSKDFRTLHGTIAAAVSLAEHGPERTVAARKRAVAQAMRDASSTLGNTPAIARASYVDPRVVDLYDAGTTIDPARTASAEAELRRLLG
ncbi:DNA topoisomerase IB [Luteimicrobium subarcticum]|uniref:DNA topoisomerase n=1 Tax=Luteimicrobium subarcticum TaxID=620910 RepID=A0A2M8WQU9_9MICO|nr:DNA topoisomerase IB [Luteimicrobium subarcticum]PJI93308.1 DNA topoisomerase-1 [Luteimicrobium subarcticum]